MSQSPLTPNRTTITRNAVAANYTPSSSETLIITLEQPVPQ